MITRSESFAAADPFRNTVKLNQMAYEEAIKVFKKESTEDAFRAARTTREYLDA